MLPAEVDHGSSDVENLSKKPGKQEATENPTITAHRKSTRKNRRGKKKEINVDSKKNKMIYTTNNNDFQGKNLNHVHGGTIYGTTHDVSNSQDEQLQGGDMAWVPPKGQIGDGKTSLNEKYGY